MAALSISTRRDFGVCSRVLLGSTDDAALERKKFGATNCCKINNENRIDVHNKGDKDHTKEHTRTRPEGRHPGGR